MDLLKERVQLWMYCSHLPERLFVPADQERPRLQQDVQCVFLNLVKQLLKSRHHPVIHLPSDLLINTNAPPGRAEEIGGVKELSREEKKREDHKNVIASETFLLTAAITSITTTAQCSHTQYSLSFITAAITPHKCHPFNPLGHGTMERSSKSHSSGELKVNWRKIDFTVRFSGPNGSAFLRGPAVARQGGSGWLDWRRAGGVWLTCFYGRLNLST